MRRKCVSVIMGTEQQKGKCVVKLSTKHEGSLMNLCPRTKQSTIFVSLATLVTREINQVK